MEQAWTWAGVNSQPLRTLEGRLRDLTGVLILRRGPVEGPKHGAGTACGLWGKLGVPEEPREVAALAAAHLVKHRSQRGRLSTRAAVPTPHLLRPPPPRPSRRDTPPSTAPGSVGCVCVFFSFLLKTKQNSGIQGDLPNQAQGGLHLVSQLSPFLKCCYIKRLQQQQQIDKAKTQEGMQNGTGSRSRRRKKNNLQHK